MTEINEFTQILICYIDAETECASKMMDLSASYIEGKSNLEDVALELAEWTTGSLGEKSETDFTLAEQLLYCAIQQVDWNVVANHIIEGYKPRNSD